ncbi:unnamed protein product, partial [Oncorhynchus mykiss]
GLRVFRCLLANYKRGFMCLLPRSTITDNQPPSPPLPPEGHRENVNLGETFNFYMIQGLHPGTEYAITINPIFVDIEGPVISTPAKTLESSAVQTLKASAVSTNSAMVSWNSVPGATGYRLAWGPTPGDLSPLHNALALPKNNPPTP